MSIDYKSYTPEEIAEAAKKDPVLWCAQYMRNEKNELIDFTEHPYQIDIVSDMHPEQRIKKGSQVGMTTMISGKGLYLMDNYKVTIIYTFPTASDVNKFSGARFNPMLKRSSYLRSKVSGIDNVGIKSIGDSKIYFGGTFTEGQAISTPADILIHDELDFSKPDIRDVYSSRLSHSPWKFNWLFSTPTFPGFGIDKEYEDSDQRQWFVKCTSCNAWQTVDYFRNIITVKVDGSHRRHYWGCRRCSAKLDRRAGKWVAKYPRRGVHGYFIPPSICPWITPLYLKKLERRLDKKTFYNYHLGRAWSGGISTLTREVLLNASYDDQVVLSGDNYFMGVDQGNTLHVEVSRQNENGQRQIVYYETTEDFKRLDRLMEIFNIRMCVIDAHPNRHSARDFQLRFPRRVLLANYADIRDKEHTDIKEIQRNWKTSKEEGMINIDRTESLDTAGDQWIIGKATIIKPDGSLIKENLYDNVRYNNGWIQQMCNMKRDEEKNTHGEMRAVWNAIGPDHFRHADNYNCIAWALLRTEETGEVLSGGGRENPLSVSPIPGEVLVGNMSNILISTPEDEPEILVATGHPFEFASVGFV